MTAPVLSVPAAPAPSRVHQCAPTRPIHASTLVPCPITVGCSASDSDGDHRSCCVRPWASARPGRARRRCLRPPFFVHWRHDFRAISCSLGSASLQPDGSAAFPLLPSPCTQAAAVPSSARTAPRVPAPTRSREFVRGDAPRFSGTQDAHATRDTRHTASSAATTTRAPFAVSISSVSVQRTTGPARGASASTPSAPHTAHSSSTDRKDGHITAVLSPPALLHIHIHIPSAPAPPPSAAKPPISTPPPTPARPASRAPAPIQTLPTELLEHVLLLAAPASPAAPAALARTCRAFAALVYAAPDQHLWRGLFLRAWDDPRALSGEAGVSSREGAGAGIDWGRKYRRRVAAQRWFASARADAAGAGTMGARDVARTAGALEALVVASPPTYSPRSFAVNLVSDPFAQHANACAVNAPPHASKWALSGLTRAPSIRPPRTRRAAWGARSARSAPTTLASSNCAGPASYIIAAGRSRYIHMVHHKLSTRTYGFRYSPANCPDSSRLPHDCRASRRLPPTAPTCSQRCARIMDYPRIGCAVKVRRAYNSTAAVSVPRHLTPAPDRACILPLSLRRQRHGSSASSRPDDLGKPAGHDVQTAGTRIKIPAHVLRPRSLFSFDGSAEKEADSAVSHPRYIPTISCPGELPIPLRPISHPAHLPLTSTLRFVA
ncbi:hypothetical protein POSPLADRAFT_1056498 [Postia placenta MAD-698-R-SB12]|uniref:F-box domain-containing protein n=1 Tax=Postia placenta MAD-698-R-SB12 TaxID=670580 RepID=A0A1X6N3F7_9APHY|nr:hypothetical protein POSPLADRAFT_1056498 [Postia placenta MAD-698-R-SB12]OSX63135.1 hypothetical protein POSPLADRAFT_1056498 [Postia placenta MAD-698-R-SB12]